MEMKKQYNFLRNGYNREQEMAIAGPVFPV